MPNNAFRGLLKIPFYMSNNRSPEKLIQMPRIFNTGDREGLRR